MAAMQIVIEPNGTLRCIYDEGIDLAAFGRPVIRRASHVEPDADGQWLVDMAPSHGPVLGPFAWRSQALDAEIAWLQWNCLSPSL